MCFFSIIIPCYNVSKHIENSIKSVLTQSFTSYELLLVNDASEDNTLEILEKFQTNERVSIINNEFNKGVSYSRNQGILHAKGTFLLFLDGDDEFEKGALEGLFKFYSRNKEVDIISFAYKIIEKKHTVHTAVPQYNEGIFFKDGFLKMFLKRQIRQHICSLIVRSDIIKQNDIFFDESTYAGEDQEFQIRAMLKADRIAYLAQEYFSYRIREDSFMNAEFNIKRISSIDAMLRLKMYFHNTKLYRYFVNYATLEVFSVVRHAMRANKKDYAIIALDNAKPILNENIVPSMMANGFIILILKIAYRLNRNLFLQVLRLI